MTSASKSSISWKRISSAFSKNKEKEDAKNTIELGTGSAKNDRKK